MVRYSVGLGDVTPDLLGGFFVGWPVAPPVERLHAVLARSEHVVLARDAADVVGFVYAVSDGGLSAYLPLLEVRPGWQGRGIGTELVRQVLELLSGHYMVDVVCDERLVPFYERLGGVGLHAVGWRDRDALS